MEFEIFDKRSLIPLSVEKRGRGYQSRITLNFPIGSRTTHHIADFTSSILNKSVVKRTCPSIQPQKRI